MVKILLLKLCIHLTFIRIFYTFLCLLIFVIIFVFFFYLIWHFRTQTTLWKIICLIFRDFLCRIWNSLLQLLCINRTRRQRSYESVLKEQQNVIETKQLAQEEEREELNLKTKSHTKNNVLLKGLELKKKKKKLWCLLTTLSVFSFTLFDINFKWYTELYTYIYIYISGCRIKKRVEYLAKCRNNKENNVCTYNQYWSRLLSLKCNASV